MSISKQINIPNIDKMIQNSTEFTKALHSIKTKLIDIRYSSKCKQNTISLRGN
jgi:hypothetical protein